MLSSEPSRLPIRKSNMNFKPCWRKGATGNMALKRNKRSEREECVCVWRGLSRKISTYANNPDLQGGKQPTSTDSTKVLQNGNAAAFDSPTLGTFYKLL